MKLTNSFLIDVLNPDGSDEEIREEVHNTFNDRFVVRWCGETNWCEPIAVVLKNGRAVSLRPGVDRSELFEQMYDAVDKLTTMLQERRWEYARLVALQCVAEEFPLDRCSTIQFEQEPQPEYWGSFETLIERVLAEMPGKIAALWQRGASLDGADAFDVRFTRRVWSERMSRLLDSIFWGHPPFTERGGSPKDYRAFNLSANPGRANAILFVKIHDC